MAQTFYETAALAAFALLGLWWVVVADRRREWATLPYRRRQAYSVSLYFALTGTMSLVSLNSGSHPAIWRTAFGIAGALGAAELLVRPLRSSGRVGRLHEQEPTIVNAEKQQQRDDDCLSLKRLEMYPNVGRK